LPSLLQTAHLTFVLGRSHASSIGTTNAGVTVIMKDLVFVGITLAFFWIAWVYTKSFDRL
jgi:hypothetical protein